MVVIFLPQGRENKELHKTECFNKLLDHNIPLDKLQIWLVENL